MINEALKNFNKRQRENERIRQLKTDNFENSELGIFLRQNVFNKVGSLMVISTGAMIIIANVLQNEIFEFITMPLMVIYMVIMFIPFCIGVKQVFGN